MSAGEDCRPRSCSLTSLSPLVAALPWRRPRNRCKIRLGWTPTHQVGPGLSCHQGDARRSVATVQSSSCLTRKADADLAAGSHRCISPRKRDRAIYRRRWRRVWGRSELPTRIHTSHRTISLPDLTGSCFEDEDACVVLVFIRLRSLLFALCPDHPVALCGRCQRTYTPEQLGTKIGDHCSLCHDCGFDLRESVVAHARTCANLTLQRPLARMASETRTSSASPPEVSERFAARHRARLGLDVHAKAV